MKHVHVHVRVQVQVAWVCALGLWAAGCQPSDRCDPGYEVVAAACVLADAGSSAGDGDGSEVSDASVAGDAAAADSCQPGEGDQATFGKSCDSDADCACPAPVCLPTPLGYCSQIHCGDQPEICPDGFTCFEVPENLQQDGVTHLCLAMGG